MGKILVCVWFKSKDQMIAFGELIAIKKIDTD